MNVRGIEVTERADADGYAWTWTERHGGQAMQREVKWVPNSQHATSRARVPPGGWNELQVDVGDALDVADIRPLVASLVCREKR